MIAGLSLMFGVAGTLHAEFVSVVQLTDLRGNISFQVCTDPEKKALEAQVRAEEKVYAKALEEAKKEWKIINTDAFPSSRIKRRTLRVLTTTSKREEAEAFLSKRQEGVEHAISEDKKEQARVLNMKPTKSRSRRGGSRSNAAQVAQQQKEVKEDIARDATADKAEEMLRKKLSALAGHEVPFFGEEPPSPKKAAAPKKK